ncbi:MAG: hypothetical protein L6R30_22005 [Thermoanaerobaculia bacterium]|nr:hypothetical protein [Thermoanaerobaculia bacterium]
MSSRSTGTARAGETCLLRLTTWKPIACKERRTRSSGASIVSSGIYAEHEISRA